jgi:ankyrin repeat protein
MKTKYFIFLYALITLFLTNNSFCAKNEIENQQKSNNFVSIIERPYRGRGINPALPQKIDFTVFRFPHRPRIDTIPNKSVVDTSQAIQHNASNVFLSLPQKISHQIILESITSNICLENDIKEALKLSRVSKQFNKLSSQDIGQYLSHYSQEEKDAAFKKLFRETADSTYANKRQAAFILIYAGAHCDLYFGLAISQNDSAMIRTFLAHKANPNQKTGLAPIFFSAKTTEIAQLFIAQGIDINASDECLDTNILWHNIFRNPSSELIRLFLEHGADARKIQTYTGNCIFHHLAEIRRVIIESHSDYIIIGELLFDAAPDMINTLNKNNQTPLDFLMTMPHDCWNKGLISPLIALFKKHGAKTAQQLESDKSKPRPCFIMQPIVGNMRY